MPTWMTVDEAAAYCRVSRATFYRWVKDKGIPYSETPSGRKRFKQEDLDTAMSPAPKGDEEK